MKTLKMVFAIIALSCISSLGFADIHFFNNTPYYLSVRIPYWVFIGVKEELKFDVAPGGAHSETKDHAYIKEDVYVEAYRKAPAGEALPVAVASFGKNFGGSLADVNVFTQTDPETQTITLKVAVEAR